MTRDPAFWPFATLSPWNYPIGSAAVYATPVRPSGGRFTGGSAIAGPFSPSIWVAASTDPVKTITMSDRNSDGSYGAGIRDINNGLYNSNVFNRHIPSAAHSSNDGFDNNLSIMTIDHLTAMEGEGTTGPTGGPFSFQGPINIDLKGPGWGGNIDNQGRGYGGHLSIWVGSGEETSAGLSAAWQASFGSISPGQQIPCDGASTAINTCHIAGAIRAGELLTGTAGLGYIAHAIAVAFDRSDNNQNLFGGFVWPGTSTENPGGWGSSGNVTYGQLAALLPSFALGSLATAQARMLAQALITYGCYLRDTAGNGSGALSWYADGAAINDMPGSGSDPSWLNDLNIIAQNVVMVTNSYSPTNGGRPRSPGIKLDLGDGTVDSTRIAPSFAAAFGGGAGTP